MPVIRLPGHVVLPLPPIPVPRAVVVGPNRGIAHYDPRYERGYGRGWQEARRDWRDDRRDNRRDGRRGPWGD